MVRLTSSAFVLVALAPLAAIAEGPATTEQATAETRAAQHFHKLGAKLIRDIAAPGRPVVRLELVQSRVTDADLRQLAGLIHLRDLNLSYSP